MAERSFAVAVAGLLGLLATGCGGDSDAARSPSGMSADSVRPATTDPPVPTTAAAVSPTGFDRARARLLPADAGTDPVDLDVWLAAEPDERLRGLTAVTDLDGADGMLFVFDAAGEHRFYMWQTPMPLDIYFFGPGGHLVGTAAMEPCMDPSPQRCARYWPGVPFVLALEVPAGSLDPLGLDETWTVSLDITGDIAESAVTSGAPGSTRSEG